MYGKPCSGWCEQRMSTPPLRIEQVDRTHDRVLRNLFEHYMHDMAEWFGFDSEDDGSYSYPTGNVWDQGSDVFIAYAGTKPVAFALVDDAATRVPGSGGRDLKEFFVVRRHRRSAVGTTVARRVWDTYPGPWLVRVYRPNKPAVPFWRQVISDYTGGQFNEHLHIMDDGREWCYFTFANGNGAGGG